MRTPRMYSAFLRGFLASRTRALITVLLWVVLAGALAQVAPDLKSVEDSASANLPPATADSMRARELTRSAFPDQTATPAIIVVRGPDGDRTATEQAVRRITATLSGPDRPKNVLDVISSARDAGSPAGTGAPEASGPPPDAGSSQGLVSPDGRTQMIIVPLGGGPVRNVLPRRRRRAALRRHHPGRRRGGRRDRARGHRHGHRQRVRQG
ncbi:MMPL family transporter [Microtetraspora malaysiensis]|uniref:MMPL family transporter n=1 Tax=Microtetraspora malaysiensis TaxID=161358 RepID=UPI003D923497